MICPSGIFIVIEGPSGGGKSTLVESLTKELNRRDIITLATKEPSHSAIGELARQGTEKFRGKVLACLITSDRYCHLESEILPALKVGKVVVCDRYVPTSLVLQEMDGVDREFLRQLNQYAERPDLTVLLLGDPTTLSQRTVDRGVSSRFHHGGPEARAEEIRRYRELAAELRAEGAAVLEIDVTNRSAAHVMTIVLEAVLGLR